MFHEGGFTTELKMEEMKLLGVVPGVPQLLLPAWLVGYLIVVLPLLFALKRVLGIL